MLFLSACPRGLFSDMFPSVMEFDSNLFFYHYYGLVETSLFSDNPIKGSCSRVINHDVAGSVYLKRIEIQYAKLAI